MADRSADRPVVLAAAGGLAREVLSVLHRQDRPVLGLLDDAPDLVGATVGGVPVLGPLEAIAEHGDAQLVLCAGKGTSRRAMAERLGAVGVDRDRYATVVDPTAVIGAGCTVGAGSIVLAGTVLTADVSVGAHVVIMPRVTLTHDDVVADFATLCAGVTLGGNVTVGSAAYLGMSSSVRERVVVGERAVLGMAAALLADLPAGETWVGVPARPRPHRELAPSVPVRPSTSDPHLTGSQPT